MAVMGVTDHATTYVSNKTSSSVAGNSDLSKTAQSYLSELKRKYSEVNITVADFKSERQSDAYMFGSSGNQNVALSAGVVEKMASDPAAAAKYEKVITDMPENAKNIEKFAKENNQVIYGSGVVIDKNGKVSYWMIGGDKEAIENPGTAYKEKVQRQLEEKREKKLEDQLKEKRLHKAESLEELLKAQKEKNNVEESEISVNSEKKAAENGKGLHLDISI